VFHKSSLSENSPSLKEVILKVNSPRYVAAISFFVLVTLVASSFAQSISDSSSTSSADVYRELEAVKAVMELSVRSRNLLRRYEELILLLNGCETSDRAYTGTPDFIDPLAPEASLCISGSLVVADPNFNRPLSSSTGTGIGNGTVGNCSLSASGTATNYDVYSLNLTGCTTFPTTVDISLCGPAGCAQAAAVDTVLVLYRNVAAGDPLTANGGLGGVFNPAAPCTNARAGNDDSGNTPTSPGGSTCDQLVTTNCPASCPSTAVSTLRRTIGSGSFTVVVTGFGNGTVGNYNLYVNAPGAGCQISLAPTAAGASIGGRISTPAGDGIAGTVVTLSGGNLLEPQTALTGPFGYYSFENLAVGSSYFVTVSSKRFTFAEPTRVINLVDNVADANFVSEQ